MINNFENFSWEYNPEEDPYVKRSNYIGHEDPREVRYEEVIFFNQLEHALIGVVDKPNEPPVACYSSAKSLRILQDEHGLCAEDARLALEQLMDTDFGPQAPQFIDTSIVEKK